jgi:hypothetical protein
MLQPALSQCPAGQSSQDGHERSVFDFEHLLKREGAPKLSPTLFFTFNYVTNSVFLAIGFFWLIASFLCLDISWFMLHSCQMFSNEM